MRNEEKYTNYKLKFQTLCLFTLFIHSTEIRLESFKANQQTIFGNLYDYKWGMYVQHKE